jgi:TatD DNase family protein
MFIDTHTHLYLPEFKAEIHALILSCIEQKIEKLFLPNIDKSTIDDLLSLSAKYPTVCYPMMGLHPCSVKENYSDELKAIEKSFDKNKYIAVGEIGIDLYWDSSTLAIQKEAFITQINWAKKWKLPVVIHARNSFDEIFEVLDEYNDDTLSGVFHCFTGDELQAKKIIAYNNFKLGIGGVVTFKNAGLDNALSNIELKHLVLETDSPYLSPVPFRGKRNESTNLIYIAEKLATIYNCSLDKIAIETTKNALDVFKL